MGNAFVELCAGGQAESPGAGYLLNAAGGIRPLIDKNALRLENQVRHFLFRCVDACPRWLGTEPGMRLLLHLCPIWVRMNGLPGC
jgi:hypothetical protein